MHDFCQKTVDFICNCSNSRTTQVNESVNSLIARNAQKNISYGNSYEARVAVAIAKKNSPKEFVETVMKKTGTYELLDEDISESIIGRIEKRTELNEERRSGYERNLITSNRIKTREAYKSNKPGDYNEYKFEDWIMLVE